jgi:DNA topoisomerase-1
MPAKARKSASDGPALVIVESPAKAKTISRFLGDGYRVEASYGHIRDLPESADEVPESVKGKPWAKLGVNIEDDFQPVYVVSASKKKYVAALKKAMSGASQLLLATDEDREGESISWHLLEELKPKIPVSRIVFHEITPEAIEEALANPRDVDEKLVNAQESRRILDRLFGYSLSPVLWKKVQGGLSAGRVQSVAVRLIVEREEERRAFKSSVYWDLEATLAAPMGEFKATLVRLGDARIATGKDFDSATGLLKKSSSARHLEEKDAKELAQATEGAVPWRVTKAEEKPATQRPYPPFTTSTLQQEANRKLGFSADRTMRAAQHLYEGVDLGGGERVGLITYMRTDSVTLSQRALREAEAQIKAIYGADYTNGPRPYTTKSRNAQEAHEAIRPTRMDRLPQDMAAYLGADERKIYELVWKRTIASQMVDARLLRSSIEITSEPKGSEPATFLATGKKILFPGFLRAYVEGSDDPAAEIGDQETILPDLKEGDQIPAAGGAKSDKPSLRSVLPLRHETTPPARYTEASLVKRLEEEGVGRPSTYASIISTIQRRGYVFQPERSKNLVPTFTAMAVTNLLRKHFGDYVDLRFTARMEDELDEIARGERSWKDHVKVFYRGEQAAAKASGNGRSGHAMGLENLIAHEQSKIDFPAVELGQDPETGQPVVVRVGRFGPFVVRGEGGEGNTANVPENMAPADFSVEQALALIKSKAEGPRHLGVDPKTNLPVYAARGRFGPYVQLGDNPEGKAPKPKRSSLPKGMSEEEATLELALKLLSLPRELGKHPESGEPILANIGRFGPYVQHGSDFRSLGDDDDPYTVELPRALELLSQPKGARRAAKGAAKKVLKELGAAPDGRTIQVLDGRYGPYVTDGSTHASLPKAMNPDSITLESALDMIAAKEKNPSKKKAAKKATKKAAKKAAKG